MTEEQEEQVAWLAVGAELPVIASDGQEIGHVLEVAALPEDDIFHGLVFKHSSHGKAVLAPALDVARITNRAAYLTVDHAAAEQYEEFHELHASNLGLRGILGFKHLGWKDSSR